MDLSKYYGSTVQGPYLNLNEDTCLCDLENNLFCIFDGFGGAGIGDKGANFVKEQLRSFYTKTTEDIDATMPFYFNFHYNLEMNAVINALLCSHRLLLKENSVKKISQRAGVSTIIVCQSKNILNLVSVGNTYAYLLRDNELYRIFENEQDFSFFRRNSRKSDSFLSSKIPYTALGMYYQLDYVAKELKLKKGDRLLLASDGAVDRLDHDQIKRVLLNCDRSQLLDCIMTLYSINNQGGNKDNQSAIILEY